MENKELEQLKNENKELLKALNDLYTVKGNTWNSKQAELQFKTFCEVEEVLNKYNNK